MSAGDAGVKPQSPEVKLGQAGRVLVDTLSGVKVERSAPLSHRFMDALAYEPPLEAHALGTIRVLQSQEYSFRVCLYRRTFYLTISSLFEPSLPKGTRRRKAGRSDSIRSMGFPYHHTLPGAPTRRIAKPCSAP